MSVYSSLILLSWLAWVARTCDQMTHTLTVLRQNFRQKWPSSYGVLTTHLIRAWLAFEPFWSNFFDWDFQLRGILFKKWSWARFFRRPLYQCDFEICSTTPQLDPNRKPIWFCNCKLRYTVWENWDYQLVYIQFSANLKQLFVLLPSFLPSFTTSMRGTGGRSHLYWR